MTVTTQTHPALAAARAITVIAANMCTAQCFDLTDEDRAILTAKADAIREFLEETGPQKVSIPVRDFGGALIGHISYML